LQDTAVPSINTTTTTESTAKTKRSAQKSLITRKRFYKTFEERLSAMGLDGRKCLLRSICEASELPVHEHNGLVGDIFHIFFT
jgi:DM4/DM12 family